MYWYDTCVSYNVSAGFPFDQSEKSEDDFEFAFSDQSPGNQETGGAVDALPFSFNFWTF